MTHRAVVRATAIIVGLAASTALAQGLPTAKPEVIGLSPAKLQRLTDGFQDREKQIPMKPDSIFWIASLTKPVATVAAMMLVEEGKLQIDDPVQRLSS
jgi:CubicO group peptidase (beta-lactamase class C family)